MTPLPTVQADKTEQGSGEFRGSALTDRPAPDGWLRSGEYLPDFMRDYHDQKDLFKALDEVAQRSVENGNSYIRDLSWVTAQVYVVDVFLWCLARRGYTLQRSRKHFQFEDVGQFTRGAVARWRERAAQALGESRSAK